MTMWALGVCFLGLLAWCAAATGGWQSHRDLTSWADRGKRR